MKIKKFIRFMVEVIGQLEREHRLGTAHVYQYALNAFRTFVKAEECWARSLDAALVKEFEAFMKRHSLMPSTSATYMRMLRATYNRAAVLNLVGVYNRSLFSDVYTGTDSLVKRALPPEVMGQWLLMDEEKELPEHLRLPWACFSLMFLLRGMPLSDLARLRQCDYKDGVISYCRHKTDRPMTLAVPADAQVLLERYANTNKSSPYLLPLLSYEGNNLEEERKEYQLVLSRYNYGLAQIGETCQIKEKISSYTARHTWATTACAEGAPIDLVCSAMGHSSSRVTQRYVKTFENKKINEMNESLISCVKRMAKSWKV